MNHQTRTISKRNNYIGILLTILASLLSSLMALLVKLCHHKAPIPVIMLARYSISFMLILLFLQLNKKHSIKACLLSKQTSLQIIRGALGFLSITAFFLSTKHLSLALSMLLFSTTPFFVPLIAMLWHKTPFHTPLWWIMLAGFIGVCCIIHPDAHASVLGISLGLLSGLSAAFVIYASRILSYNDTLWTTIYYDFLVGFLLSIVWLIAYHPTLQLNSSTYSMLLLIGLLGCAYLSLSVMSTHYAPVRLSTPFTYAGIVFSMLLDWIIWHHSPSLLSYMGIIIISLAGFLMLKLYPLD